MLREAPRSSESPGLFGRMKNLLTGASASASAGPAEEARSSISTASKPSALGYKRAYGFATSNLAHYNDKSSEDLYRFKHIGSDYMRQSSPTREEEEKPAEASAGAVVRKSDSDSDSTDKPSEKK